MKTKLTLELVERNYWECLYPKHRHRSKGVAEACITKRLSLKKPTEKKWTPAVLAGLMNDVLDGSTIKAAGAARSVSAERARQLLNHLMRKLLSPTRLDEPLPHHETYSWPEMRENKAFWKRRLQKFQDVAPLPFTR